LFEISPYVWANIFFLNFSLPYNSKLRPLYYLILPKIFLQSSVPKTSNNSHSHHSFLWLFYQNPIGFSICRKSLWAFFPLQTENSGCTVKITRLFSHASYSL